MNDSTNELLKQLERATAAAADGDEPLDEETAALRESWQALDKLLAAADADAAGTAPQPAARRPLGAGPRTRRPRRWVLAAAVALSTLLALAGAWLLVRPALLDRDLALPPVPAPAASGEDHAPQADRRPQGATADELAWHDSFDEDLARTRQSIYDLRASWHGERSAFDLLQDRLLSVEDELEDNAL